MDSARRDDLFVSENKVELKDYFVSKEWHRPYVEVLLETDGTEPGRLLPRLNGQFLSAFES